MKRYWILMGLMLAFFLATFGILTAFHVPFMEDPTAWMKGRGGWIAALTGVALLIADVFLPVPSSLVMIAHGALFGGNRLHPGGRFAHGLGQDGVGRVRGIRAHVPAVCLDRRDDQRLRQ